MKCDRCDQGGSACFDTCMFVVWYRLQRDLYVLILPQPLPYTSESILGILALNRSTLLLRSIEFSGACIQSRANIMYSMGMTRPVRERCVVVCCLQVTRRYAVRGYHMTMYITSMQPPYLSPIQQSTVHGSAQELTHRVIPSPPSLHRA
jgi:hypothetical protein